MKSKARTWLFIIFIASIGILSTVIVLSRSLETEAPAKLKTGLYEISSEYTSTNIPNLPKTLHTLWFINTVKNTVTVSTKTKTRVANLVQSGNEILIGDEFNTKCGKSKMEGAIVPSSENTFNAIVKITIDRCNGETAFAFASIIGKLDNGQHL